MLVAEHGMAAVTMSQIAEVTGIGRATLYKYFPDVEAILNARHEEEISQQLEHLAQARDRDAAPGKRLAAVLATYAEILHERMRAHDDMHPHPRTSRPTDVASAHGAAHGHAQHAHEIGTIGHRGHSEVAQRRLAKFFEDVLTDAVRTAEVRKDVDTGELVTFCLHALAAARALRTRTEIASLVDLTLSALRGPTRRSPRPRGARHRR